MVRFVHLKDVARIELGGENYNVVARINGKPASGLGIKLATGANALDTANAIKAKLVELQPFFPQGNEGGLPVRHDAVCDHLHS